MHGVMNMTHMTAEEVSSLFIVCRGRLDTLGHSQCLRPLATPKAMTPLSQAHMCSAQVPIQELWSES